MLVCPISPTASAQKTGGIEPVLGSSWATVFSQHEPNIGSLPPACWVAG